MTKKEILTELLRWRYAHRGFHQKPEAPENSLAAFRRALLAGFGIELDIHLTRDGQLAVIHDASLKRTCGVDRRIEELTLKEAQEYCLEESDEHIPDFAEVLKLVDGMVPLIVELKTEGGNHEALCRRAFAALDQYKGLYCVESFDPKAVLWLRRNRPQAVRGQLAGSVRKDDFPLPALADFLLRNLWVNVAGKPDFVAYKFAERENRAFRRFTGAKFFWTIRSEAELSEAERLSAAAIFEGFDPRKIDEEKE